MDQKDSEVTEILAKNLKEKIKSLREEMERTRQLEAEMRACAESGISVTVPRPQTSNNKAKGLFDREEFHYVPEDDAYRCPAGEHLPKRTTMHQNGMSLYRYWSSNRQSCSLKSKCTTGRERRVTRWAHEVVLETAQDLLDRHPEKMRARRDTVEYPFGTLKRWVGWEHFPTRTFEHVSAGISLSVLAYNLKRAINIMGIVALTGATRAFFVFVLSTLWQRYPVSGSRLELVH